jgi:hypothetical protein
MKSLTILTFGAITALALLSCSPTSSHAAWTNPGKKNEDQQNIYSYFICIQTQNAYILKLSSQQLQKKKKLILMDHHYWPIPSNEEAFSDTTDHHVTTSARGIAQRTVSNAALNIAT